MRFDDKDDPAMRPVYEAGGGESEGFELAEDELIEHSSHGDMHGTTKITEDAEHVDEEAEPDEDLYGEPDDIDPHEHEDDEDEEQDEE
jgi:hypothetical protein